MVISKDTANLLPRNESSHQLSGNLMHGWTETGHGGDTYPVHEIDHSNPLFVF